jgi:hypothetical protein
MTCVTHMERTFKENASQKKYKVNLEFVMVCLLIFIYGAFGFQRRAGLGAYQRLPVGGVVVCFARIFSSENLKSGTTRPGFRCLWLPAPCRFRLVAGVRKSGDSAKYFFVRELQAGIYASGTCGIWLSATRRTRRVSARCRRALIRRKGFQTVWSFSLRRDRLPLIFDNVHTAIGGADRVQVPLAAVEAEIIGCMPIPGALFRRPAAANGFELGCVLFGVAGDPYPAAAKLNDQAAHTQ